MTTIQVKNIKKSFEDKEILKSVNLDIQNNEFVVLLGPSGCGKSTLLRIIAGLETEDSGDVLLGDERINHLSPRDRHLSMVFQNYAVFPHMTVAENIGFGLAMRKESQEKINKKVQQVAALMHIEDYLHRYSGQLSGGQRQRVAVARALAVEPELLLMDEPLSNLDALLRLEMRSELKTILNTSNSTTIYVTHDQVEAMSMADRIAVMYQGEIQQYANAEEIYDYPATEFVGGFIGNPPMNFFDVEQFSLSKAPAGARRAGIRPENLAVTEDANSGKWKAHVMVVEALGSHKQLNVLMNGEKIRINAPSSLKVDIGQTLGVNPIEEHVRWYDQTGHIIL